MEKDRFCLKETKTAASITTIRKHFITDNIKMVCGKKSLHADFRK